MDREGTARLHGFLVQGGSGSPGDHFPPPWGPSCPVYAVISWEGGEGGVRGCGVIWSSQPVSDCLSSPPEWDCVPRSLRRAGGHSPLMHKRPGNSGGRGQGGEGSKVGGGGLPLASVAICWPHGELQSPAKASVGGRGEPGKSGLVLWETLQKHSLRL